MGQNDNIKGARNAFEGVGNSCDEIMFSKLERYGTENISKQGMNGLAARMEDKLARIRSLLSGVRDGDNESLRDTLMDLRNYAQIATTVVDGTWPGTKGSANDNASIEPGDCLQMTADSAQNITKPHKKGDVGYDIRCSESTVLRVTESIQRIKTGVSVKLPNGFWAEIRSRSSTTKNGIFVVSNTIDNGYIGELFVDVVNTSGREIEIEVGDRVAQLVMFKSYCPEIMLVEALPSTERGETGFGSTGK